MTPHSLSSAGLCHPAVLLIGKHLILILRVSVCISNCSLGLTEIKPSRLWKSPFLSVTHVGWSDGVNVRMREEPESELLPSHP